MAFSKIVYEPYGVSASIDDKTSVLANAQAQGIKLRSDCGGRGLCGRCRIGIQPPGKPDDVTEAERQHLSADDLAEGHRLACQTTVGRSVRVVVPAESIDADEAADKTAIDSVCQVSPLVSRRVIRFSPYTDEAASPRDFVELLQRKLPAGIRVRHRLAPLKMLSELGGEAEDVTAVCHRDHGLCAVLRGSRPQTYGLAVDIGTTTLAGYLCDLATGAIVSAVSEANPQRRYGEDVISRIAHANGHDSGTRDLRRQVVTAVNSMIRRCLDMAKLEAEAIDEVCLAGNTTMQQLFLGLHPRNLGSSPYRPVFRGALDVTAGELGLDLHPGTNVHLFPVVSGFVGGDTVAAAIADRLHEREEISLLIDIGTNGELVLGNRDRLWATSCATGPALEGAHISCGMRAVAGAIDRVRIPADSLEPQLSVLGPAGTNPIGICGSGIIDAIAEMGRNGIVTASGRLCEQAPGVHSDPEGIGRRYTLRPADTATGCREIAITLADVRQIQLAKAALYTGITLLQRTSGLKGYDRLVLTGAFGARFNWRNAVAIGLLPPVPDGARVEIMENGAGRGAIMALLNGEERREKDRLADSMQVVELSEDPEFQMLFAESMTFAAPPGQSG